MAKVDKEFVIKNRFWIVLGGAALLLLFCWLMLLIGGAGASAAKQRDTFNKTFKTAQENAKQTPKNDAFKKPWVDWGKQFTDQKDTVWKQAWLKQADMYTWPPSDSVADFTKLQYPDDELGPGPNEARKHYAKDLYIKQFRDPQNDLYKLVEPAEFNGLEAGFNSIMAPALAGGGAGGVVGPMPGGPQPRSPKMGGMAPGPGGGDKRGPGGPGGFPGGGGAAASGGSIDSLWPTDKVPSMEEIWLAQEDFWVKREMLKIIRDALDTYASFTPVEIPKDEPMPDKVVSRHRFRNPTWEVTLLIEDTKDRGRKAVSARSTIKNVSLTKRTQLVANPRTGSGLKFALQQNGSSVQFEVAGEPLPYGTQTEFGRSATFDTIDFTSPFGVKQVLEWATSPIRRIDELRTARNSSRLAIQALKHNDAIYPKELKEAAANQSDDSKSASPGPGAPPGSGAGGPGPGGDSRFGPGGPGGFGGMGGAGSGTAAGIERDRYLLTNEQCRHLPIAMVLVVDQAAVNDVLVAVANSRLKIQITQVHLVHVPDPGPQVSDSPTTPIAGGGPPPRPGGPGGLEPGFEKSGGRGGPGVPGGKFGGPGPGSPPTGFLPGGTGGTESEGAAEDNNLFELTVYGVATLYERYPKKEVKEVKEETPAK